MLITKTLVTIAIAGTVAAGTAVAAGVSILRDRFSYGEDGFNANGYDKEGYDRLGYNKAGYNREGYNSEGLNKEGYNRKGYDKSGRDKSGFTRAGYAQKISAMEKLYAQAKAHASAGDTETAFLDVRKGLEQGVRCVLSHSIKEDYSRETLFNNLAVCQKHNLFEENFLSRLHRVRMNCNEAIHGDSERRNALRSSFATLEELIQQVREMTDNT